MSHESIWQDAWVDAQSRLESIRGSLSNLPYQAPRILRVGQLDSELLDQELLQLLKEPITRALATIQGSFVSGLEPELTLLIQTILYKLSIWDSGATYGAKLQGLRYDVPSGQQSRHLAPSGIPQRILAIHALLTVLVPYAHTRLRSHALSRGWADAPSSARRRKAWEVLTSLESTHSSLGLLGFIMFLWDGRYRTISDRLLGLRLVPVRRMMTRDVSYEFMNRQMVWHAFTEFLLFLLPLIKTRVIKRRMIQYLSQVPWPSILPQATHKIFGVTKGDADEKLPTTTRGKYWLLPDDQCAICAEDVSFTPGIGQVPSNSSTIDAISLPPPFPIHTPYQTSCDHTYCYFCLSERMIRAAEDGEEGWQCLRCEQIVRDAKRVEGQIAHERDSSPSDLESDDFSLHSDQSFPSSSDE